VKTIDSECWNTARRFANQPELALPRLGFGFSSALDGNLTQDGLWTYEWNADEVRSTEMAKPRRGEKRRVPYGRSDEQNRLVAMESRSDLPASVTRQRLEFAYDSRSRRIEKTVKEYDSGTSTWTSTAQIKFLYDGWNLLAEYDALNSDTMIRSHVWGLDLSGTPQGVGGVGGLLWSSHLSDDYAPGFDANGNIIVWVDLSDGSLAGTAEYGAFGETLALSGVSADLPFGFSTKYEDFESALLYYGYRFYSPGTGRWPNRDPIGIDGGLNEYGMLNNDPLNWVDLYGLKQYNLKYDLAPSASFLTGAKSATGFSDIMADVESKIDKKYSEDGEDPCNCIESIKIGGHGGPGLFFGDGDSMSNDNTISNHDFNNHNRIKGRGENQRANHTHQNVAFMNQLAAYMCKGGTIEIIACELCAGDEGDEFTGHMEDIFGEGNFKGYDEPVKWGPFGVSEHPNKEPKK